MLVELLSCLWHYVGMTKTRDYLILTFFGLAILTGCSSITRTNREPSAASGQDGQAGSVGARGQGGQAGKAFLITNCDGLLATAVYRTSNMRMWPEELRDMCSVRSATSDGLANANAGLDAKIERLLATGYLRGQDAPKSFGDSHSTEIERLTAKMIFVNELDKKVSAQQSVSFGCHRARITNRHKEERSYNVCMNASLNGLSREGDVRVNLELRAYEIATNGTVDPSAFIIERTRLLALPKTCANGVPIFEHTSIESNGTQFRQTVSSTCESYTVDSADVYPRIEIQFERAN